MGHKYEILTSIPRKILFFIDFEKNPEKNLIKS
jgi:hypothetical protein